MKKEQTKGTESQLLNLLKKVLPKATHDPQLASKIYQAVELELKASARATAFEKFCNKVELPSLDAQKVEEVRTQLTASFPEGDVALRPNKKDQSLAVEVALPDGSQFSGEIKVNPEAGSESGEEAEIALKFVPFPVSLPGDPELIWLLAKRENMSPEEAGIALFKLEEDFWASKAGQ